MFYDVIFVHGGVGVVTRRVFCFGLRKEGGSRWDWNEEDYPEVLCYLLNQGLRGELWCHLPLLSEGQQRGYSSVYRCVSYN